MPSSVSESVLRFVSPDEGMPEEDDPGCRQLPERGPVRFRDLDAITQGDPAQQGHDRVGQIAGVGWIIPLPLDPIFGLAEQFLPPCPGIGGEAEAVAVPLHDPGLDQFPIGGQSPIDRGHPQPFDAKAEDGDGVLGQRDGLHGGSLLAVIVPPAAETRQAGSDGGIRPRQAKWRQSFAGKMN
jgi:hypothetical protein